MSKLLKYSIFTSLFLFVIITVFTSKIESPVDGKDQIGFPFRFYEYYVGVEQLENKSLGKEVEVRHFYTVFLLIDLFSVFIPTFLSVYVMERIFKGNS